MIPLRRHRTHRGAGVPANPVAPAAPHTSWRRRWKPCPQALRGAGALAGAGESLGSRYMHAQARALAPPFFGGAGVPANPVAPAPSPALGRAWVRGACMRKRGRLRHGSLGEVPHTSWRRRPRTPRGAGALAGAGESLGSKSMHAQARALAPPRGGGRMHAQARALAPRPFAVLAPRCSGASGSHPCTLPASLERATGATAAGRACPLIPATANRARPARLARRRYNHPSGQPLSVSRRSCGPAWPGQGRRIATVMRKPLVSQGLRCEPTAAACPARVVGPSSSWKAVLRRRRTPWRERQANFLRWNEMRSLEVQLPICPRPNPLPVLRSSSG